MQIFESSKCLISGNSLLMCLFRTWLCSYASKHSAIGFELISLLVLFEMWHIVTTCAVTLGKILRDNSDLYSNRALKKNS